MFERFTERARMIVLYAQEEARKLKANEIGTEHLLLGAARGEDSVAARVLDACELPPGRIRHAIEKWPREEAAEGLQPGAQIPFSAAAKRAMELALREALSLGSNYIGSEHLLLGLLREDSVTVPTPFNGALVVLGDLAVEPEAIRNEVVRAVSGKAPMADEPALAPWRPRKSASPEDAVMRANDDKRVWVAAMAAALGRVYAYPIDAPAEAATEADAALVEYRKRWP